MYLYSLETSYEVERLESVGEMLVLLLCQKTGDIGTRTMCPAAGAVVLDVGAGHSDTRKNLSPPTLRWFRVRRPGHPRDPRLHDRWILVPQPLGSHPLPGALSCERRRRRRNRHRRPSSHRVLLHWLFRHVTWYRDASRVRLEVRGGWRVGGS